MLHGIEGNTESEYIRAKKYERKCEGQGSVENATEPFKLEDIGRYCSALLKQSRKN